LAPAPRRTVLVVEDDADLGDLLRTVFTDAGYAAAILPDLRLPAVLAAVERLEPACVLLDGEGSGRYGASWEVAAGMRGRSPPVPAVMFTADDGAAGEARAGASARSRAAGFAGVLPKPFDLDDLLATVAQAVAAARAR
jgi:CheY-like chemotaxis protein